MTTAIDQLNEQANCIKELLEKLAEKTARIVELEAENNRLRVEVLTTTNAHKGACCTKTKEVSTTITSEVADTESVAQDELEINC